jgi:hypothetical protein
LRRFLHDAAETFGIYADLLFDWKASAEHGQILCIETWIQSLSLSISINRNWSLNAFGHISMSLLLVETAKEIGKVISIFTIHRRLLESLEVYCTIPQYVIYVQFQIV